MDRNALKSRSVRVPSRQVIREIRDQFGRELGIARFSEAGDCGHEKSGEFAKGNTCAIRVATRKTNRAGIPLLTNKELKSYFNIFKEAFKKGGRKLYKKINAEINADKGKLEKVNIDDIFGQQSKLVNSILSKYRESYKSGKTHRLKAYRLDGKVFLQDYHHRVSAAKLEGVKSLSIRVVDLDKYKSRFGRKLGIARFSEAGKSGDCGHDSDGKFSEGNTCAAGGGLDNIKEFRLKNGFKLSSDHLDLLKIIGGNRGPMNAEAIRRNFDKKTFKDIRQAYSTVTEPARELIEHGLLEKVGQVEGHISGPGYSYVGPGSARPDKVEKNDSSRFIYDLTEKGHELVSKWLGQDTRKEPAKEEEPYKPDRKETEEMIELVRKNISRIENKIQIYKREKKPILLKEQEKKLKSAKENLFHYEKQLNSI